MVPEFLAAGALKQVYQFFAQGGYFMVLLLVCSVIAVTVILIRGLALRRHLVMPPTLEQEIERILPAGQADAAVRISRLAKNDESALARITHVALSNLNLPKDENQNATQTTARHEIVKLESGLHVLEIIIGISPLLGLLGAVSGLVQVFGAFGNSADQQNPHMIAKGIAEALSTTVVGIAIAIPSLIAHGLLSKRVETMAAEMELLVSGLIVKCYHYKNRRAGNQSREVVEEEEV